METTTPSQPWAGSSSYRMIDVGAKTATARRAVAQGSILLSREAFVAIREKKNPKGDVLALAEAAGIMSAKRTADLIPLCHPLPLDYVRVSFELSDAEGRVTVFCEAGTTAKTGVEMEALAGVNGALLTVYDLSKAVNPELTIQEIRLNLKEGGKSGLWTHPAYKPAAAAAAPIKKPALEGVRAAVVTISDRVSRGQAEDKSGPALVETLKAAGAALAGHVVVSDDREKIQAAVTDFVERQGAGLVVTTGGTGFSPRDVTPEALTAIAHRMVPGFGELLRQDGATHIKTAWLSRSVACIIKDTLVVALPGSRKAVAEGMEVLLPLLPHALHTLRGGNHD